MRGNFAELGFKESLCPSGAGWSTLWAYADSAKFPLNFRGCRGYHQSFRVISEAAEGILYRIGFRTEGDALNRTASHSDFSAD